MTTGQNVTYHDEALRLPQKTIRIIVRTMNAGTGFGGEATDYNNLVQGQRLAQQRQALRAQETCNYLQEMHQTLQHVNQDALLLVRFMDSPDKAELVHKLKEIFLSFNVTTDMSSTERELLKTACDVCDTLAMDVQLTTLFGSSRKSDSLYSILIKFCQDAEYVLSRSGNSQMNDLLLTSQIVQLKDKVQRTVEQLQPYKGSHSFSSQASSVKQEHGIEEYYKNELEPLSFDLVETLQHHAFEDHVAPNQNASTRQWFKELAAYKSTLPVEYGSSIFVRAVEQQLSQIRVMILGPDNTPYAHGAFMFDVFLPPSYPHVPPKVKFLSTGNGKIRFNPNLYANGKVCLSLLGTWSGPSWIPGTSTLLQVLISIQSLILVPDPYYNEPGYEGQRGTRQGERKSLMYNKSLRKQTCQVCILNVLEYLVVPERNIYREFQQCMVTHFLIKKQVLEEQVMEWAMADSSMKKMCKRICYLLEQLDNQHPGIARSFDVTDTNEPANNSNVASLPAKHNQEASSTSSRRRNLPFAKLPRYKSESSIQSRNSLSRDTARTQPVGPVYVTIPENVSPGDTFEALIKGQITKVKCPEHGEPGRKCPIFLNTDIEEQKLTATPMEEAKVCKIGGLGYIVTVPRGVSPGQQFHVKIQGKIMAITCPAHGRPGAPVKIFPNPPSSSNGGNEPSSRQLHDEQSDSDDEYETFPVVIPEGVKPGHHFAISRNGIKLVLKCPPGIHAGEELMYRISMQGANAPSRRPKMTRSISERSDNRNGQSGMASSNNQWNDFGHGETVHSYSGDNGQASSTAVGILEEAEAESSESLTTIHYRSTHEYVRILVDDRFFWNKTNQQDFGSWGFDLRTSAFGRKLEFKHVVDGHRGGELSMVPVGAAVMEASVKSPDGVTLVTSHEIAQAARMPTLDAKVEWFRNVCAQHLRVPVTEGFMRITIPRGEYMFQDSVRYVMQLSRLDMRKRWQLGYLREHNMNFSEENQWYQHVLRKLFDPDLGLWQYSHVENELRMQIHPASGYCCEDHLQYFRFGGRILGKALLEGRQILTAPLDMYILKLLVGWPLYFRDIRNIGEEQYRNLDQLDSWIRSGEDVSVLGLNFTTSSQLMGKLKEEELIAGGRSTALTNHNFDLYVEANLRHCLLDRVKSQLTEFVLGFFDVIPEALLAAFDYTEFEKLIKFHSIPSPTTGQ